MKVEFNSKFINKVKKQLAKENEGDSRRRRFKKNNINKNYFILLGFMVLLIGANISRNLNQQVVEESAAPVFSKVEDTIKKEEKEDNNYLNDFSIPISKNKLLSYNYANGIMNLQVEKGEKITSMTGGIVDNIYLDYTYGYTVVIRKNDNITCKYSNLDSNALVSIGDNVQKGQIIGKTLDYSLLDTSYIYISVYNNGKTVNISQIFDSIK